VLAAPQPADPPDGEYSTTTCQGHPAVLSRGDLRPLPLNRSTVAAVKGHDESGVVGTTSLYVKERILTEKADIFVQSERVLGLLGP
jgi:hypothetical protein